jgi:hypothetical protein
MTVKDDVDSATMSPEANRSEGQTMVGQALWAEIRRAYGRRFCSGRAVGLSARINQEG